MSLELKKYDLYQNGQVEAYADTGEQYLVRTIIDYPGDEQDLFHKVMETDRLTYIAWYYWKDIIENASKYWWVLADANLIENPLDISSYVGKNILIPNLTKILLNL